MILADEIKILHDKIKANQAQQNLDREAAKISALLSEKLDKYEYLTGEDLGYKPGVVEQAKFEYSPLSKVFNKGLKRDDKEKGLWQRLKNIEGKNEEQLEEREYQGERQLYVINKQEKKQLEAIQKQEKQLKKTRIKKFLVKQLKKKKNKARLCC